MSDAAWFFGARAGARKCAESVGAGGTLLGNPVVVAAERDVDLLDYDIPSVTFNLIPSYL